MKTIFYEFYPFVAEVDRTIIIEIPPLGSAVASKIAKKVFGYLSEDYYTAIDHDTLESATARDRGCDYTFRNKIFSHTEKQGQSTSFNTEYVSFARYISPDFSPKTISGMTLKKAHILYSLDTLKILKEWGYSIAETVDDPNQDGCICRNCKGFKYMSAPDGLVNDGMLTCYMCKDRMKRYGLWPYDK